MPPARTRTTTSGTSNRRPAIADAERAWACFRAGAAAASIDEWWQVLGPHWGPFAEHSLVDLVLHALHEVTHHAAEIALLRDLYAARARRT